MAAAAGDNERRWVIVGICLHKVLTPALRDVVANEIPVWYQSLLPHDEIDKQTFGKHKKSLPPALQLNYGSINNNFTNHKSSFRKYDYAVKDAVSLAKLFMKPFMAGFTGFDHTMDTSAVLSVVAEAQPFHASGASGIAQTVRSDIRNKWAHCDFTHWTDVAYEAALKYMEKLINGVNLTPAKKKKTLDDLVDWKEKGLKLCFGQAVDSELLELVQNKVAELKDLVKNFEEETENKIRHALETVEKSLKDEIQELKERQLRTEKEVEQLRAKQNHLQETISKRNENEPRYLFMAPKRSKWFSGRESELGFLRDVFENKSRCGEEKVLVAAVSGLGGCGKTSLTAEYMHRWKGYYQGGVYWFSAENDVKFKASVDEIAAQFNILHNDSFDVTFYKTLAAFSSIKKPWLVIIDNMDEPDLSPNLLKLVSGKWQANAACYGHLIISTRRTPQDLEEKLSGFEETDCLKLECFGPEEAKDFVFRRTNITRDVQKELSANSLCQNLGGLPLALEQACAYIKYLGCSISDYLGSYEQQSLKILNKKKASSLDGTSPERLAVRTTWLLNFEHIKKDENGIIATRFLNASAFLDRNEIQKDLINVGEPPIDDKAYCDHVSSSVGPLEVLKLLTDFSLFKKTHDSSLTVHRLVQEVIRDSLTSEEKVESIVDAARLLRFALSKCPSPDTISESVVSEYGDRPSLYPNDSSNFYKWHKLCLHAHEIRRNLECLLGVVHDVVGKTVFLPEIARVVYECALHLNVNNLSSQAKIIGDFANRILDCSRIEISESDLRALFPHMFPLSESVRRCIKYSCEASPPEIESINTIVTSAEDLMKSEIEKLRLEGNDLFKKSNFEEAVTIYSSCIDRSIGKNFFDLRLFSNRASAYLRLKQFKNALSDAEEYIKYSPDCWKGHARKALALHGLNEKEAVCAAALAFYYHRSIFDEFEPFITSFPNMKERIHTCDNVLSLVSLLSTPHEMFPDSRRKIILLKPGNYHLSVDNFKTSIIQEDNLCNANIKRLLTGGFSIVGGGSSSPEHDVSLSFECNFGLCSVNVMAFNISFVFDSGNWLTPPGSAVKLLNCSFTSSQEKLAFVSQGNLSVKECIFDECKNTALAIGGEADVENSVFSGNKSAGLELLNGNLEIKNCKLYGNRWGFLVRGGHCNMSDCQVYDNNEMGIGIMEGSVKLARNRIFHNDRHGVFVRQRGSAVIEENEIFENNWLGIRVHGAFCHVSRNRIYQNKCGGIHVVPVTKASRVQQSIIESNRIFSNEGPGIDHAIGWDDEVDSEIPNPYEVFSRGDEFMLAKCTDNEVKNNMERGSHPPQQRLTDICFRCHKKGHWKKCDKCFIAGYCGPECIKVDFENHKKSCAQLLEKYSVLVNVPLLSSGSIGDKVVSDKGVETKMPWAKLEPSGRAHAEPPEIGERFVVKIQACDGPRISNRGTLLSIEDRSLSVNGRLDTREHSGRIYHLVRECGCNCANFGWKKMFFWALLENCHTVRLFLSDLPTGQLW